MSYNVLTWEPLDMNNGAFVWGTAIIFITTPTDNKLPREVVCHPAGGLWQMTSTLLYCLSLSFSTSLGLSLTLSLCLVFSPAISLSVSPCLGSGPELLKISSSTNRINNLNVRLSFWHRTEIIREKDWKDICLFPPWTAYSNWNAFLVDFSRLFFWYGFKALLNNNGYN